MNSLRSRMHRVDEIEISLTPKEWSIRLLDDVRQYPTERDFFESMQRAEFEDCLLYKPLPIFERQAELRYPGKSRQSRDERADLYGTLATEFVRLKTIISRINKVVQQKTESAFHVNHTLNFFLVTLFLEQRFQSVRHAINACVRRTGRDRRNFDYVISIAKGFHREHPPTSDMIESSANALIELLKSLLAHEAGVKIIEDRYFDGHPVLFRDIEDALKQNIDMAKQIFRLCHMGFPFRQRGRFRLVQERFGCIDVNELEKQARALATTDILNLNGVDLEDRWRVFRAMTKREVDDALGSPILD